MRTPLQASLLTRALNAADSASDPDANLADILFALAGIEQRDNVDPFDAVASFASDIVEAIEQIDETEIPTENEHDRRRRLLYTAERLITEGQVDRGLALYAIAGGHIPGVAK